MSCFICLEENGEMISQGCVCKGSMLLHKKCFSKWCTTAEDPFTCTICKTPLSAVLLEKYIGMEKIMFFDKTKREEFDFFENDFELIENHGVLALIEDDGHLLFQSVYDLDLYMESDKREFQSQKKMVFTNSCKNKRHFSRLNQSKNIKKFKNQQTYYK